MCVIERNKLEKSSNTISMPFNLYGKETIKDLKSTIIMMSSIKPCESLVTPSPLDF